MDVNNVTTPLEQEYAQPHVHHRQSVRRKTETQQEHALEQWWTRLVKWKAEPRKEKIKNFCKRSLNAKLQNQVVDKRKDIPKLDWNKARILYRISERMHNHPVQINDGCPIILKVLT